MSTAPVFVAVPHVVSEEVEGEAIVINLDNGAYFSFRDSALLIWQLLLQGGGSLDEMVEAVGARYEGEREAIFTAVAAFVKMIQAEGLVAEAESLLARTESFPNRGPAVGDGQVNSTRVAFVVPTFEKHTDMEEFLLVDPIHEVDVSEWPAFRKRD